MEDVHLSSAALFVFFGANATLCISLLTHARLSDKTDVQIKGSAGGKQLAQPLTLTLASITDLSKELCRLGALLIFAWVCEHRPIFDHQMKNHDMDMYWFMAFALAVMSFANVRKSKGGDILNREQTEEWKGWMQFAFLMYHYFSASEVYNVIRVLITSYVWMTGFGNFSFFYMKEDYSAVRVLQMMWRLNFLVACLCLMMGNTYILYYICPLHTFYFLFTYAVMRVAPSVNHGKWGIRVKLLIVGVIIYAVWDLDLGLFSVLFSWLSQKPVVGASSGTLWEWYFRSSLDHWSTFLGMIYALNFPVSALWMKKVEAMPPGRQWLIKGSVAAAFAAAMVWWALVILPQPKLDYNLSNAYFGVPIPMLAYVFWRNLSPGLRTHYLEPLHSLGKITLETYLMQHHVWLTSNAKTVLVLIPSFPRLNILVAGCLYLAVSSELHRLTMTLRGMLMPDCLTTCLKSLLGIAALLAVAAAAATGVAALGGSWGGIVAAGFALGVLSVCAVHAALLLKRRSGGSGGLAGDGGASGDGFANTHYDGKLMHPVRFLPAAAVVALALLAGMGIRGGARRPSSAAGGNSADGMAAQGPHDVCVMDVNKGMWETTVGTCNYGEPGPLAAAAAGAAGGLPLPPGGVASAVTMGYCNSYAWEWVDVPDQCHFHFIPDNEMVTAFADKDIVLVGDSILRFMYYAMIRSLGHETPDAHDETLAKHQNLSWDSPDGRTRITFIWAPFIHDMREWVPQYLEDPSNPRPHLVVAGCGLWDVLHEHDAARYGDGIEAFAAELRKYGGRSLDADVPLKVWVKMTSVSESRLMTPEKQQYLTAAAVNSFEAAADRTSLLESVHGVVDGRAVTAQRAYDSYDGVHYPDFVYDVMQQLLGNVLEHYGWAGDGGGGRARRMLYDAPRNAYGGAGAYNSSAAPPPPGPRKLASTPHAVGSMSNPYMGAAMLVLAAIMIFARDAYDGLPALALRLFGGGVTLPWQEAYGPLLARLGKAPALPQGSAASVELASAAGRGPSERGSGDAGDDDSTGNERASLLETRHHPHLGVGGHNG